MSRSNSSKRRTKPPYFRIPAHGRCPVTGKIVWPNRAGARQHLRQMLARGETDRAGELSTYRCEFARCGGWHVGGRASGVRGLSQ